MDLGLALLSLIWPSLLQPGYHCRTAAAHPPLTASHTTAAATSKLVHQATFVKWHNVLAGPLIIDFVYGLRDLVQGPQNHCFLGSRRCPNDPL